MVGSGLIYGQELSLQRVQFLTGDCKLTKTELLFFFFGITISENRKYFHIIDVSVLSQSVYGFRFSTVFIFK